VDVAKPKGRGKEANYVVSRLQRPEGFWRNRSTRAKEQLLYKELVTLDDALISARHMERAGRLPMLIEGDDGTRMDRREIGEALGAGGREQVGN